MSTRCRASCATVSPRAEQVPEAMVMTARVPPASRAALAACVLLWLLVPATPASARQPQATAAVPDVAPLLAVARYLFLEVDSLEAVSRPAPRVLLERLGGGATLAVIPFEGRTRIPARPAAQQALDDVAALVATALRDEGVRVDAATRIRHEPEGSPVPRSLGFDVNRLDGSHTGRCRLTPPSAMQCTMEPGTSLHVQLTAPPIRGDAFSINASAFNGLPGEAGRRATAHFSVHVRQDSGVWRVERIGPMLLF
jgi:hypothetical protein